MRKLIEFFNRVLGLFFSLLITSKLKGMNKAS